MEVDEQVDIDLKKLSEDMRGQKGPQECSADAAEAAASSCPDLGRGLLGKKERRSKKWRAFVKRDSEKPRAILKTPFRHLCKDLLQDLKNGYRIGEAAVDCLHQAAEAAMTRMLAEANIVMEHAKRSELYPRDIRVLQKLRSHDVTFAGWEPVGPDAPRLRLAVTAVAGWALFDYADCHTIFFPPPSLAGEGVDESVEIGPEDDN